MIGNLKSVPYSIQEPIEKYEQTPASIEFIEN